MENVVSKFVQEVIAKLTGDTDKAIALKNERLAKASIKGQLSALEGQLVEAEVKVENAQEKLNNAIYPTVLIESQQGYCNNIEGAQENLNEAKEELEDIQSSIKYFNDLLESKF